MEAEFTCDWVVCVTDVRDVQSTFVLISDSDAEVFALSPPPSICLSGSLWGFGRPEFASGQAAVLFSVGAVLGSLAKHV